MTRRAKQRHPATAQQRKLRHTRVLLLVCVIGVACAIFYFSSQDAAASSATSGRIRDLIIRLRYPQFDHMEQAVRREIKARIGNLVRKGAHFTEFAALGFFLHLLLKSFPVKLAGLWSWLGASLYAVTDEYHQLFTSGRAGQWQDVLLDSAGVLTGCLIAWGLAALTHWAAERRHRTK